ncbi:MAG: hypothetical protein JWP27_373 [Flaviaesturariibacter sp.]|nr:hypothetical protein [Flaviaesturariibacter sp.]
MEILAHRGFWTEPGEKNSELAFIRSATGGFGIETDVRDLDGQLVISHDMPRAGSDLLSFDAFLDLYYKHAEKPGILAINIKADGLQKALSASLARHGQARYFVFDMSIPDTIGYKNGGMPFYARISEYEPEAAFADECAGIWLDAFEGTWYGMDLIRTWLDRGKCVCIVSPELHKRPHDAFWAELKKAGLHLNGSLLLCTDFPDQALTFFHAD